MPSIQTTKLRAAIMRLELASKELPQDERIFQIHDALKSIAEWIDKFESELDRMGRSGGMR